MEPDVKWFIKPWYIFQTTVSKPQVSKATLLNMSMIEMPFQTVGVDIISYTTPSTATGSGYGFIMAHFVRTYPDKVASIGFGTADVAEKLVEMFSKVELLGEVVTDRGKRFSSAFLSGVSRLHSLKQLTTTPCRLIRNGLVERLSGTPLQIIRKCVSKPMAVFREFWNNDSLEKKATTTNG